MTAHPTPNQPRPSTGQHKTSAALRMRVSGAAALAGCAWFVLHNLLILFAPEDVAMQWLYDDAFYYMIAAKHFSERHLSSFDGITLTSGYHPLWMWLCSLIYGLRGRLDMTYVRSCMALTLLITCTLLFFAVRHAFRQRNAGLLWAIALATTSYSALNNGITVMEWPLVLLSWFLLHTLLTAHANETRLGCSAPAAFLFGVLGSFSRTDFGLVPACYLAAAVLLALSSGVWAFTRRAALATAGSLFALPLIFLYNHHMTGSWLQSSAEVKHLAATLSSPFNALPALWQFARVLLYLPPLNISADRRVYLLRVFLPIVLAVAAMALGILLVFRKRLRASLPAEPSLPAEKLIVYAGCFAIAGYAVLYGFNSLATFGWYTGAVTGFIVLLAARLFNRLSWPAAAVIVVPLMLANVAAAQYYGGNSLTQMPEVWCGRALHRDNPNAIMGGGDVGKPSFYNDGRMFNLDGLMNNEVVPYIKAGRIHCYLLHRNIEYIYNIGTVAEPINEAERARHGERPSPWDRYLTLIQAVPAPGTNPSQAGQYFKVNVDAIRRSGECDREP